MDLETLSRANRLSDEIKRMEAGVYIAQRLRCQSGPLTLSRYKYDICIGDRSLINNILSFTEMFFTNKLGELKTELEKL